jgi:cysteine desulfurase
MKVYFDNAATTPIDPEVVDAMVPVLREQYGNPSSIHTFGRESRALIEKSRKQIAGLLNVSPAEIFFTAGGTEADNMIIRSAVRDLGVRRIISSKVEHHAVLYCVQEQVKEDVEICFVNLDEKGYVDMHHLEELLANSSEKTLVSLMHANNEIGNMISLEETGTLCRKYDALFHSDTVQTMAHYAFDFATLPIDFATCSAHKFHGPKGVGFLYMRSGLSLKPMIIGGSQERNMRAGTENIYGIVGLAKALEIALRDVDAHQEHVQGVKTYMIEQLKKEIPGIQFNGDPEGKALYTVLNVALPNSDMDEMLLYNLDIEGIAVSGGSACSSGSNVGSHVLAELHEQHNRPSVRFSFSKYNTREEVDYAVGVLKALYSVTA